MTSNLKRPVRHAVFPVAGLGTRILPATKAMPKEMLTLVDRPLLQHAVEEARAAGITEFVFVSSTGKHMIEDHFDVRHELNNTLERRGKTELLQTVRATEIPTGHLSVVRQHSPLGLGHAVWTARKVVGDNPFAVLLADDMFLGPRAPLQELMDSYSQTGGNYIAAMEVREDQVSSKGIITPGKSEGNRVEVKGLVEKPKLADAPSRLAILGRYILQPEIFGILEHIGQGSGGEIQLTDGLQKLLQIQPFYGCTITSRFLDCGDKFGWLEANIAFALANPSMRPTVQAMLKQYAEI
jgi:UTP--glucose-1-phosphate uridylyltransferase